MRLLIKTLPSHMHLWLASTLYPTEPSALSLNAMSCYVKDLAVDTTMLKLNTAEKGWWFVTPAQIRHGATGSPDCRALINDKGCGWVGDTDLPISTLQRCKWLQLLWSVLSWQYEQRGSLRASMRTIMHHPAAPWRPENPLFPRDVTTCRTPPLELASLRHQSRKDDKSHY